MNTSSLTAFGLSRARRTGRWIRGRIGKKADRTFRVRLLVQTAFALASLFTGVQLARFYRAAQAGSLPLPNRPPGVEAYLPISGLMGFLDWLYQGTLNLLRKAFCSWVCPVGFLSELLARFGRWSFGRNVRFWKWLDIPLRSTKYLLLAFFLAAILSMSPEELQAFIHSPYNRVAEVKMGLFFLELSRTGIIVLGILVLASVFIRGAWCRYLCPYGALLGFFSWLSPTRIARNTDPCVNCGLCDRACMAHLPVSRSQAVKSPECTGCLDCMAACPVAGALELKTAGRRGPSPLHFAVAVVGLFLAGYLGARATGSWTNEVPDTEYIERIQNIDSGEYLHPGR